MIEKNIDASKLFASELADVKPSPIHAFDEKVSDLPNILKLTIGEPDFSVPDHIKQAAVAAILADDSHYSVSAGTNQLRQAASHFLADRYDIHYDANTEILTTIGATEGLYAILSAILDENDEVIIPTPAYPVYAAMTRLNKGKPLLVDISQDDFILTPDHLRDILANHNHVKALILTNPSNPTGVTYSAEALSDLADVLRGTDVLVISDEIYSELRYDDHHVSMATFLPDQTLVINGVSKSHAMTGYRIGIIAGPAALITPINMVHSFIIMTPSNPAMAAATEAFDSSLSESDTETMKKAYRGRRDFLVSKMKALGFEMATPNGAFYIFAKIPETLNQDDVAFAYDLVDQEKLAVVPGSGFGPGGEGYVRLSYAASMAMLTDAMDRLSSYCANNSAIKIN
ncbi:aminotransferase class I/II-fold pyridoxal phosphate-dependent enzyme [Leuconostoc falkenbergense]|uniref:aminotransferase class I/II-fold pyridoxal phosphate-dependent enzyme n=1 Tax=Leuconostoc falkenbergense TaxID=2766470 RepID=UPI0024A820C2|nr:aminotransferase class I/II-fold pyridoxal phosphate-dependent enzyme [Leuconostoc falkenbergense]MDI6552871.1 aminotransferase class I/II-fold pyridoxal phosphate-dependent enzyme [Leuconostoc falkenbergense]